MGLKSPASETAEFVSVFRSGSCSEKGPKQYMEDEYICVDDLHEHLGQMENLPSPGKAVRSAFVKADHAFADASSVDKSSGTTALTALILGSCVGEAGRAIELSKDHKPNCTSERLRIENGYLNGQLSVARALGDWRIKGSKGSNCPLSSEPELEEIVLTEEDEFLIMGCDGLWDVMSSQCAVTTVRKELLQHNDPERCSKALVKETQRKESQPMDWQQ
ncbi:PREDICTED: probable phosphatase 2C [Prunus dulcis]|uniref:PREDICTED: probable phosphatase 2C n=1 Tax=Prunus dulcis TaxID=3755 RepID=A0A5E4GGK0_PRUDU|nr:PREDICTED: probable phosphatase 2C [Prunus dulcis]